MAVIFRVIYYYYIIINIKNVLFLFFENVICGGAPPLYHYKAYNIIYVYYDRATRVCVCVCVCVGELTR